MSGDLKDLTAIANTQTCLFPGASKDNPWEDVEQFKRYQLSFPFYPFRTLCPRELASLKLTSKHEFDPSSPLIPANTQINFVFNRRDTTKLINYFVPFNLNMELGTNSSVLTEEQRKLALTFTQITPPPAGAAPDAEPTRTNNIITGIEIIINDMFLQVRQMFIILSICLIK